MELFKIEGIPELNDQVPPQFIFNSQKQEGHFPTEVDLDDPNISERVSAIRRDFPDCVVNLKLNCGKSFARYMMHCKVL